MAELRHLICSMDQIADGGALEVRIPGPPVRFVALLRRDDRISAFVNRCPHAGRPLNLGPDQFLFSPDGDLICAVHGARFRVADGECTAGPCIGARLQAFPVDVEDGMVFAASGRTPP